MIKRRTRILAGTLASAAMALSFTESVVASTCVPMMEERAAVIGNVASDGAVSTPADRMFMAGQHNRDDMDPKSGDRPPGPEMGCCCISSTSLPALPSAGITISTPVSVQIILDEVPPNLLLTHALFHPPRA